MKIDKNIPIYNDPRKKFYFDEMEVGDSFFSPGGPVGPRSAASIYGKRHGKKFTTRQCTEDGVPGVRIWRVE